MNKNVLPEQAEKILSEKSIDDIETAISEKIELQVEAALTNQDELYAEKLQELVSAIDKDHSTKLTRVVEAIDHSNAVKLVKVVKKYEKEIGADASKFKNTLVESISDYIEEYIQESVPTEAITEATQNRGARDVLNNLRKVLAVDSSLMNESVKEAVVDGKQQISSLTEQVDKLEKENNLLKEAYHKNRADLLLETKTAGISDKKKEYLKKILSDKTPKFIEENFDYTAKLFDKKENERIKVIKEEAFVQRKVKTDAPRMISKKEKPKDARNNPYLEELKRVHK